MAARLFLFSTPLVLAANLLAPKWSGSYIGYSHMGPGEIDFYYDLPNSRMVMNQHFPFAMMDWFWAFGDDASNYTSNLTMNYSHCVPHRRSWNHTRTVYGFGWLEQATWIENTTVMGKNCTSYAANSTNRFSWAACIDDYGVPLQFSMEADPREVGASMSGYLSFSLTLARSLGPAEEEAFEPSYACSHWPLPLCEYQGLRNFKVYRDTSVVTDTPAGQNVGDLRGQTMTACMYSSPYIAEYEVVVNSSYGQYALCNYISNDDRGNVCVGGGDAVGRAPWLHICHGKELCGQCTNNSETGSWFSFPKEGECKSGTHVGTDGCTWQGRLTKIVDYHCALGFYLKVQCATSLVFGQDALAAKFAANMAECPDVRPSENVVV